MSEHPSDKGNNDQDAQDLQKSCAFYLDKISDVDPHNSALSDFKDRVGISNRSHHARNLGYDAACWALL
ncbi:MAG TPA: hypothetical protein VK434_02095, partial [Microvirga sp.]|nr:hypothetical protein [Microvirga sp.]